MTGTTRIAGRLPIPHEVTAQCPSTLDRIRIPHAYSRIPCLLSPRSARLRGSARSARGRVRTRCRCPSPHRPAPSWSPCPSTRCLLRPTMASRLLEVAADSRRQLDDLGHARRPTTAPSTAPARRCGARSPIPLRAPRPGRPARCRRSRDRPWPRLFSSCPSSKSDSMPASPATRCGGLEDLTGCRSRQARPADGLGQHLTLLEVRLDRSATPR